MRLVIGAKDLAEHNPPGVRLSDEKKILFIERALHRGGVDGIPTISYGLRGTIPCPPHPISPREILCCPAPGLLLILAVQTTSYAKEKGLER
jgi:hypothetical protein